MKKHGKRLLLITLTLIFVFGFSVYAQEGQSICVNYTAENHTLSDASFSLYRIGTLSGTEVIAENAFSAYRISYDISDSEKAAMLALTLSSYILKDNIAPDYTDKTDSEGKADFDKAYPAEGVYLLMGEKHRQNNTTYFCEPVIFSLTENIGDCLIIKPKYEAVPDNTAAASYRVLKAWKNDTSSSRPSQIEVELLKDSELFSTAILNTDNNWSYQWDNLSPLSHWTVVEKNVPDGYTVSLSQSGKAFLLTNYGSGTEKPTIESTTTDTSDQGSSVTETTPQQDTTNNEDELPDTGALKWPIPYLACAGLILLLIGYVKYRKSELADE